MCFTGEMSGSFSLVGLFMAIWIYKNVRFQGHARCVGCMSRQCGAEGQQLIVPFLGVFSVVEQIKEARHPSAGAPLSDVLGGAGVQTVSATFNYVSERAAGGRSDVSWLECCGVSGVGVVRLSSGDRVHFSAWCPR
jgi:hypothetical protein